LFAYFVKNAYKSSSYFEKNELLLWEIRGNESVVGEGLGLPGCYPEPQALPFSAMMLQGVMTIRNTQTHRVEKFRDSSR